MLQFLFRPVVLAWLLTVIAVSHIWLYAVHGITDAIVQLLYRPALIAPVFAVILVAGIVHEFGHASALRYGGGRARSMGAGFYLIYPALYTDTSDSYRLTRAARIRVDLGGFYFHLLFAVALMAVALATSQEYLLIAVLVIDLEIVRQLLFPFVRFDGYWLFADLTGVPDFYTYMGPLLASALPGRQPGAGLPRMKRWVKAVFLSYTALAIPVLGGLAYLFVTRAPGFVAVAWDSINAQADALGTATNTGDLLGMIAAATQMLLLVLPLIGGMFVIYATARSIARLRGRNASRPAISGVS